MYMDCGHPGPDDCYGDMFAPTTDVFISRGDWHALEMMIHPGTPNGTDGSQTFWIDGEKMYTAEGIAWRTTDELRPNQVGVYLYIHHNPAFTTNILDLDNVLISRSYIGPAPCQVDVEIAAPCICGGSADPENASNVFDSGYCCAGDTWQPSPCGGPVDSDGGLPPGSDSGLPPVDPIDSGTGGNGGGCGCRFAGPADPARAAAMLAFALAVLAAMRRRKR
jgi:MYXO-CTERM domain-containing protein